MYRFVIRPLRGQVVATCCLTAVAWCLTAVWCQASDAGASDYRGLALLYQGQARQAEKQLTDAIAREPNDDLRYEFGVVQFVAAI